MVKCRICKDDHWTTQCPYKDKLGTLPDLLKEEPKPGKFKICYCSDDLIIKQLNLITDPLSVVAYP